MRWLIITSLLVVSFRFSAQVPGKFKVDSLLNVWNDSTKPDSVRLETGNVLVGVYFRTNPSSAKSIIDEGIRFSRAVNNVAYEARYRRLMGVYHGMRREVDEALKYFNESLELYRSIGNTSGEATCLMNIGNIYNMEGSLDESLKLYEQVLEMRQKEGDQKKVASVLSNMAIMYYRLNNLSKALELFFKVSEIDLATGDTVEFMETQGQIAGIYKQVGKRKQALDIYESIVPIMKKQGNVVSLHDTYTEIGIVYLEIKSYDSALYYFKPAMEFAESFDDPRRKAMAYHNMGATYQGLEKPDTAVYYFNKAIKQRMKIDNKEGLALDYFNLGTLNISYGDLNKGIYTCLEALRLSSEANSLKGQFYACKCLSEGYEKMGDVQEALTYYKRYKLYSDSLTFKNGADELVRQEAQFQFNLKTAADSVKSLQERKLKDAQIKAQQEQLKRQNFQRWILFGGIGIALLLSLFVYSRLRITRKQKAEIEYQREIVQTKNDEITHSIQYAQRLQSAIIPSDTTMKGALPDSFVIYKPKDIVAGDFYWLESFNDEVLFAVADCTGHGVPGAMVSVVCSNGLDRAVKELGLRDPAKILDATRDYVIDRFAKSENEIKDGMDIALCVLNNTTGELKFAGANNPLYVIRPLDDKVTERDVQNEIHYVHEIKGDKQPIGKYRGNKPFVTHRIQVNKGDGIYIFTDGFADQFGGERGKKFKYKPFKKLILDNFRHSSEQQKDAITLAFNDWKGNREQIDDVLVLGLVV